MARKKKKGYQAKTKDFEEATGDSTGYKPSEKEQSGIDFVYERFTDMKSARGSGNDSTSSNAVDWEGVWNEGDKAYRQYLGDSTHEDWRSNITIPITFSQIEAQLAELEDTNLGIIVRPVEESDEKNARSMQAIIDYIWKKGNGDVEFNKTKKSALVRGTGIGKVIYRVDHKTIKEIDSYDPETQETEWREVNKFEYHDVFYKNIDLFDFYVDEKADDRGIESARDCIEREILPLEEFQERYAKYKNIDYVTAGGDTTRSQFYEAPEDEEKNEVEVLHYYNQLKDLYLIVANRVLLTKPDRPLPWKHKKLPFIRIVDYGLIGQFYGYGEPKILKNLQDELDTVRRMAIDNTHLQINKMFVVSDASVIDENDLVTRPGGLITLYGDVDKSIKPLDFPGLGNDWIKQYEELRRDVERAAGFSEESQAISASDTATQAAILRESSQKRIRYKNKFFKKMGLVEVGRLMIALVQQFYTKPKVVEVTGVDGNQIFDMQGEPVREEKFRTIRIDMETEELFFKATPEKIRGIFDIEVDVENIVPISKALTRQQELQLFEMNMQNPAIDIVKSTKKLYEAFDKNPFDYMAPQAIIGTNKEEQIKLAYQHHDGMLLGKEVSSLENPTEEHIGAHLERMKRDAERINSNAGIKMKMNEHMNAELPRVQGGQQGQSTAEGMQAAVGAQPPGAPQAPGAPAGGPGAPPGNFNAVKVAPFGNEPGPAEAATGTIASRGTTLARGQV